jgi:hypothetical protein
MKYSDLVQSCIDCFKQYNSDIEGPDSHAEKFLNKVRSYLLRSQKTAMKECLSSKFFMGCYDIQILTKSSQKISSI